MVVECCTLIQVEKASLMKVPLNKELKESRKQTKQVSEGGVFQGIKGFKLNKLHTPIYILRSLLLLSGKWIEVEVSMELTMVVT